MALPLPWRIMVPIVAVAVAIGISSFDAAFPGHYLRQLIIGASHPWPSSPAFHVFSQDPVVVYIENLITPAEAAHLVKQAEGRFATSPMWDNEGKPHVDKAYRRSTTARLGTAAEDDVVRAIEARARALPFYKPVGSFMPMVVQNYEVAGLYRDHYDWFDDRHAVGGNIASTFFVYILANCTGGGTNFARLTPPDSDSRWCEWIDCDRPLDEGVTFKPILGNAVYWENLEADGRTLSDRGHQRTLHAGMTVTSGNKLGLNLWTWKPAHD